MIFSTEDWFIIAAIFIVAIIIVGSIIRYIQVEIELKERMK